MLKELHLLFTPDVSHKTVFTNVPIIGCFKNDTSLKNQLVWAVLCQIEAEGRSNRVGGDVLVMYVN